jgi:hypothetical protein
MNNVQLDQIMLENDARRGERVLSTVHEFLGRFVAYPSEYARLAHTLWLVHTHLMHWWENTPRIAFLSPEPASGKTRALEISECLVPRPMEAVNMSPVSAVSQRLQPQRLADDLVRRNRHNLRAPGEGQRGHPRVVERWPPSRSENLSFRPPRQASQSRSYRGILPCRTCRYWLAARHPDVALCRCPYAEAAPRRTYRAIPASHSRQAERANQE